MLDAMSEIDSYSLLFIPDISGFTDFVHHTAVEHSQHIISELLELLIDQNSLELQLAEIEGDALFYYKHQSVPSYEALYEQIRKMYLAFHNHLRLYETHRICECGACTTASNLQLKFIVHAGRIDFIQVKDRRKPYGENVIKVHRLLKNEITSDEYILATESFFQTDKSENNPIALKKISGTYDFGSIDFRYLDISDWKNNLEDIVVERKFEKTKDLLEYSTDIKSSLEDVYEYLSEFKHRLKWTQGLDGMKYDEDRVNRAGSQHFCVVNGSEVEFETIKRDFGPDVRAYGERTAAIPGFHYVDTYYLLEEAEDRTKLKIKVTGKPKGIFGSLLKFPIRYQFKKSLMKAVPALKQLVEKT